MGQKEKDSFLFTHAVILDLDGQPVDMHTAVDSLELKPTIAHYTPSNQPGDIRFRFIYLFEDKLNIEEYNILYKYICESVKLKVDERVCNQYYNGCYQCEIILNEDKVYTMDQFSMVLGSVHQQIYNTYTNNIVDGGQSKSEFNNDYYQVRYQNATSGIMHDSGDERYCVLGDDYFTIDRKWITDESGKRTVGKWQPGSSRKKRLYNTALILKYNDMHSGNVPDRDWLTWCLWNEYRNYYVTHPDIDYKWLSTLSADVIKSENIPDRQEHPSFKVKPGEWNKRSMAKRVDRELRKGYTDNDILELYDPSLSLRKNAECMNDYGYKISKSALSNLLKRNGLETDTRKCPS